MAHIDLPEGLPGIRGLLVFRPETARPLRELAQVLLYDAHTLAPGERELIAALVSARNECVYCESSHSATAACHLDGDETLVARVKRDPEGAPISEKMKALLAIAAKVQADGRSVTSGDVDRARRAGATDQEIHDTVLIAAAFCMFNRYVDGLGTFAPQDPAFYRETGAQIVAHGYADPQWPRPTRTPTGMGNGPSAPLR
jgi:uncharacterized peroxidase-related enzyme